MTKITAEQARELAGPSVQEQVDRVYPMIQEAASKKQHRVCLHGTFWAHEGYCGTKDYFAACKILEQDGYKVSFYYKELQFVDMYTVVEW